jgi:hypothetical protein
MATNDFIEVRKDGGAGPDTRQVTNHHFRADSL